MSAGPSRHSHASDPHPGTGGGFIDAAPSTGKDPAAVSLGRRGGLKGGKARAAKMTPQERSESARHAANSRWWSTKKTWTPKLIVAAIQEWAEIHGQPPTRDMWRGKSKPSERGRWPSANSVDRNFGSWNAAIAAAGFEPRAQGENRRKVYPKRKREWTPEEIIALIQQETHEQGLPPALAEWRGRSEERPDPREVAAIFGSWNDAIIAAGFVPRPRGLTRAAIRYYLIPRKES